MIARARRIRRAATLAELLVVAAVIAVLAGLIVPAVGLVRRLAGATACLSNLRQVGLVVTTYAAEHGDRLPAEGNLGDADPATSPAWFHRLPPLVDRPDVRGRHSVFQCPCYRFEPTGVFDHASPKSYKLNGYLDEGGRGPTYRLGSCPDESGIVLFADAVAGDTGMGQWGHLCATGIDWERHGGRVNVLYLDGHGVGHVAGGPDDDWRSRLRWTSATWDGRLARGDR